jgi:hypothetical protein
MLLGAPLRQGPRIDLRLIPRVDAYRVLKRRFSTRPFRPRKREYAERPGRGLRGEPPGRAIRSG